MLALIYRSRCPYILALVAALTAASTVRANLLLTNPDFEAAGTTYSDTDPDGIPGWVATYPNGYGYYGETTEYKANQSGLQVAYLEGTSLQTAPASRPAVTPGTAYDLSALLTTGNNAAAQDVTLSLVFYDSTGTSIPAATGSITVPLPAGTAATSFSTYSLEATAPDNAATAAASVTNAYGAFSNHTTYADNFVLTAATPEPASLAVAGLVVSALAGRRRRV